MKVEGVSEIIMNVNHTYINSLLLKASALNCTLILFCLVVWQQATAQSAWLTAQVRTARASAGTGQLSLASSVARPSTTTSTVSLLKRAWATSFQHQSRPRVRDLVLRHQTCNIMWKRSPWINHGSKLALQSKLCCPSFPSHYVLSAATGWHHYNSHK